MDEVAAEVIKGINWLFSEISVFIFPSVVTNWDVVYQQELC